VVFARSIIPKIAIEGPLSHLQNLGDNSLGATLFDTPGIFRSSFEVALISGNNPYLPQEFFQTNPVWGRRSCFSISSNKIIVSEIFLNTFEPWTLNTIK
jgi:chorismate--pyruvate lyase